MITPRPKNLSLPARIAFPVGGMLLLCLVISLGWLQLQKQAPPPSPPPGSPSALAEPSIPALQSALRNLQDEFGALVQAWTQCRSLQSRAAYSPTMKGQWETLAARLNTPSPYYPFGDPDRPGDLTYDATFTIQEAEDALMRQETRKQMGLPLPSLLPTAERVAGCLTEVRVLRQRLTRLCDDAAKEMSTQKRSPGGAQQPPVPSKHPSWNLHRSGSPSGGRT